MYPVYQYTSTPVYQYIPPLSPKRVESDGTVRTDGSIFQIFWPITVHHHLAEFITIPIPIHTVLDTIMLLTYL
jgi:hypothetical protein